MESLGHRVKARFADDGEHQLKNIPKSVRVFRWVAERTDRGFGDIGTLFRQPDPQAIDFARPALRPEKMHPPRNVPSSAL